VCVTVCECVCLCVSVSVCVYLFQFVLFRYIQSYWAFLVSFDIHLFFLFFERELQRKILLHCQDFGFLCQLNISDTEDCANKCLGPACYLHFLVSLQLQLHPK